MGDRHIAVGARSAAALAASAMLLVGCVRDRAATTPAPPPATPAAPAAAPTPFSVTAVVRGATVEEVTRAIVERIHGVDDTEHGLVADWIVAGADELEEGSEPIEAALRLPGGHRIVEVCNRHFAGQALAFGKHRGVALPCEIAVTQQGEDVEVILLNPEGIFAVFFGDVPEADADGLAALASTVRSELEGIVASALEGFDAQTPRRDVGPPLTEEALGPALAGGYSVEMDVPIPEEHRTDDASREAFRRLFVERLLETLTYEGMEHVGSTVDGLSTDDWRAARPYALGLPGGVSVVEICSPSFATAVLASGTHHAPALPCQIAAWVDADILRVHVLDPTFMLPVFFADAPPEALDEMRTLAATVREDIELIVRAAVEQRAAP